MNEVVLHEVTIEFRLLKELHLKLIHLECQVGYASGKLAVGTL
jgi:hypothetical protein